MIRVEMPTGKNFADDNRGLMALAVFACVCAIVAVLVYAVNTPQFVGSFYDSDALYLPALFRDLFSGYDVMGWKLTPAPYYFPDMTLFFALNALTGNVHIAIWLNAAAQGALFAAGVWLVGRALGLPGSLMALTMAICAALMLVSRGVMELFPIWLAGYHFGAVIVMGFALALVIRGITTAGAGALASLAALGLCALTAPSDPFFITQFVAPVVMCVGVGVIARWIPFKRGMVWAGLPALGAALGVYLERLIPRDHGAEVYGPSSEDRLNKLADGIAQMVLPFAQAHPVLTLVITVSFAACLALAVIALARPKKLPAGAAFVALFLMAQAAASGAALAFVPVVNARYLLPSLTLMVALAPALTLAAIPKRAMALGRFAAIAGSIACLGVAAPALAQAGDVARLGAHYPDLVACMDQNAQARGLRRGLAQYWQARPVSMLSRQNLDVAAVGSNLGIFYWINNLNWYQPDDFEFVMVDPSTPAFMRFGREDVLRQFGPPSDEFECYDTQVMVYAKASAAAVFRSQFRRNELLTRLKTPGERISYAANLLNSQTGALAGHRRAANQGDAQGFLSFGPYVHLLPGEYGFTLNYSATSNAARWDVGFSDGNTAPALLRKGDLPPAQNGQLTGQFELNADGFVELRVFYTGSGNASVDGISIWRVK